MWMNEFVFTFEKTCEIYLSATFWFRVFGTPWILRRGWQTLCTAQSFHRVRFTGEIRSIRRPLIEDCGDLARTMRSLLTLVVAPVQQDHWGFSDSGFTRSKITSLGQRCLKSTHWSLVSVWIEQVWGKSSTDTGKRAFLRALDFGQLSNGGATAKETQLRRRMCATILRRKLVSKQKDCSHLCSDLPFKTTGLCWLHRVSVHSGVDTSHRWIRWHIQFVLFLFWRLIAEKQDQLAVWTHAEPAWHENKQVFSSGAQAANDSKWYFWGLASLQPYISRAQSWLW